MADTSVLTITYADTAALEAFWEDYCTAKGQSFTDAADAEVQGIAHVIDTAIAAVAGYRATAAGDVEKQTTLEAELTALAQ